MSIRNFVFEKVECKVFEIRDILAQWLPSRFLGGWLCWGEGDRRMQGCSIHTGDALLAWLVQGGQDLRHHDGVSGRGHGGNTRRLEGLDGEEDKNAIR